MAAPKLQYSVGNAASTTTSASMTNTATSTPLTSTTNFAAAPTPGEGMLLIDEGAATEELAYATGTSGGSLTTPLVNRGLEGGSAQAHNAQVSVKGVLSAGMWNNMITALLNVLVQSSGALDTTKVADLTTAQTFTNKTLTSPKIGTSILDTNGNIVASITATASAVNYPKLTNAATGTTGPLISAEGETNVDLRLAGKGTGLVHYTTGLYGDITADTDGATITFNMATSNVHTVVLGGNRTLALSNVAVGQAFILRLVQDGTGTRTVTWFTTIKWAGGSAPTLTTTINKTDVFGFICTSAGNYDGYVVGQNL